MSTRVEVHCFRCEDTLAADVEGHLQAACPTQVGMYQAWGLMSAIPAVGRVHVALQAVKLYT